MLCATAECLPHRETHTAVVDRVKVPASRTTLFLAIATEMLHDRLSDELSFGAFSPHERATFQFLLYLTYCCKGELFQVTLENPDFRTMSPPVREDFAHGRLFCFVLDTSKEDCPSGLPSSYTPAFDGASSSWLRGVMNAGDLDVFRQNDDTDDDVETPTTSQAPTTWANEEVLDEAFNAFMRLQLVRKRASSLNNAMIIMRDGKGEMSAIFDWVDIRSDTLNSNKVDRKKVKELQGSMYTPFQSSRQGTLLPDAIKDLNLKVLESSLGRITDVPSEGEGKALFLSLMSTLTCGQWLNQNVMRTAYNPTILQDVRFVESLKTFAGELAGVSGSDECDARGLLVFRYALEKLIDEETPDLFAKSLIHKHVPVTKNRIDRVLCDVKSKRRTRALASLLNGERCHCARRRGEAALGGTCRGDCQTAYSCFYNLSERHPFVLSRRDHSYYFSHLYPHLGKLERLSEEMKLKYRGRKSFESIANLVFHILVRQGRGEAQSLYEGLGDVIDEKMSNSSLSLGHGLREIHESLYLTRSNCDDAPSPVKVYDSALVRYLFCESLQVGRLFQASTTFNYIIVNTAPRYTIERIMLFNVTGPGEGKSYANNVLNYQFRRVRGCIETLTSFTPQAFKYKQKRTACVVMIDDAHITHEKNTRASDRESNVIPNTFKNLLDTSMLESDVVTRDVSGGKADTVRYQAVHNCGFVWNTNTMGFVSGAWADRCVIMESEFPEGVTRTRSTRQIQDTVEKCKMAQIAAVCLYRQNLIQSATMIADSNVMQFGARFDAARDACVAALYASHVVCTGAISRRVSACINQLVFAEALKLACHFVFDIWVPPWTAIPDERDHPNPRCYLRRLNVNRLKALNELSFGQICLETSAVYKLCAAACLPDLCPRVVDTQGRFACKALGYVLTQIRAQRLKTCVKNGRLCISGIDAMLFPEHEIGGGNEAAHEMLVLCSTCKVPAREKPGTNNYRLCTYRFAGNQNVLQVQRGHSNPHKRVGSIAVPLEAVYDMLALYAPQSHAGFWAQLGAAMVEAYEKGDFEEVNAFGQCSNDEELPLVPTLRFTLDFTEDPVRSVILEAAGAIEPLNELTFNKCMLGEDTFQCYAPLYYGGIIRRAMAHDAPKGAYDKRHQRESTLGPKGTFHGPRLSVYSAEYSGVPVKNVSSFCTTRTVYHQDGVHLRVDRGHRRYLGALEEDWEWKDAAEVFNKVHGTAVFSPETLKLDYAVTMMAAVKEDATSPLPTKLCAVTRALRDSNRGNAALAARKGLTQDGDAPANGTPPQTPRESSVTGCQGGKRTSVRQQQTTAEDSQSFRKMRKCERTGPARPCAR